MYICENIKLKTELFELSNLIILEISKEIFKKGKYDDVFFHIDKIKPNDKIKDVYFLTKADIIISIEKTDNHNLTYATFISDDKLDTIKEIILYVRESVVNDINERLKTADSYNSIYTILYIELVSSLAHELTHAYYFYISNGKAIFNKKTDNFFKENPKKTKQQKEIDYLRLQHEIDARYTQALDKVRFTKTDIEEDEKGDMYFVNKILPVSKVVNDFKNNFRAFRVLTPKQQKRLLARITRDYYKEIENIPEREILESYGKHKTDSKFIKNINSLAYLILKELVDKTHVKISDIKDNPLEGMIDGDIEVWLESNIPNSQFRPDSKVIYIKTDLGKKQRTESELYYTLYKELIHELEHAIKFTKLGKNAFNLKKDYTNRHHEISARTIEALKK